MAPPAESLRDLLFSLTTRVREIRGLALVDNDGLPLESTLGTGGLEEALGAFGGAMGLQLARAQSDFEMGPLYLAHIHGRDRQLFVVPLGPAATLAAVVDAHATPATISLHLLALVPALIAALASHGPVGSTPD